MKQLALLIVLALLVLGGLLFVGCKDSSSGSGRIESNVDLSKAERDPTKFKQGVEDLMAKEKAAKGK